ncbi:MULTISPECIES: hypothetical protein [Ralstonia solanacearum species complex]|uniref:Uncharacterized protein n=3 Tax=Ralstonia solanacearum species complex TaxID=3116862 RepID=A0A0S4V2G1_RALSL|nr:MULTISPECIES: hypothetical protein [Ralstonia]APC69081.1 hypothetical protein RSOE_19280 [Ralstonia solanacearum OE1-1]ARU23919.1 hypothetical protein RSSE_c3541 [Ralstonia solanacearum]API74186.1 hypothetical protein AC251_06210 [Ralstonia pseudosolanacearum]ASL74391.1 hypothetical protein BC350_12785 [Ralstonia pseudosolanacearum]AST27801.1 hypothetical protein CDC45_11565 [Ralstonia pseudosolanacearum]
MVRARWMVACAVGLLCTVSMAAQAKGGNAGGGSAARISSRGLANTNGPDAADRDKGRSRAADRAHQHGKSMQRKHAGKLK